MDFSRRMGRLLVGLASLSLAACGGGAGGDGGTDGGNGDASVDARPRNDRININCTSAAGDEAAEPCNARLMMRQMGSTFFIGSRATCGNNPSDPSCVPICELSQMNPENCSFVTAQPGCAINWDEGYAIVVQTSDGHRALAAVGSSDNCSFTSTGRRAWARIDFDELQGAVQCARISPPTGWGPVRYELCPSAGMACGPAGAMPADMCRQFMFMDMMGPYSANLCTHNCTGDMQCGPRGICFMGTCWARFDNRCASTLACPTGTSAYAPNGESEGPCLPLRPR